MKHAKLTESIVQQPFDVKDFKDSLVIMDDVDTIKNKYSKPWLIRTFFIVLKIRGTRVPLLPPFPSPLLGECNHHIDME